MCSGTFHKANCDWELKSKSLKGFIYDYISAGSGDMRDDNISGW